MRNIRILNVLTLAVILLAACSEDKLTPSEPQQLYEVPQGESVYDDLIVNFKNEHGTRILYKYDQDDFRWQVVSYSSYNFDAPELNYVGKSLDLIEETFDIWKDYPSFRDKLYPLYIPLSSDIYVNYVQYEILNVFHHNASYGLSHVAFGRTSSDLDNLTGDEKLDIIGELTKCLIAHAADRGVIEVPEAFEELSSGLSEQTNPEPGPWGYNAYGWLEGRTPGMPTTPQADMGLFIKYLVTMSEEDFKAWALDDDFDVAEVWEGSTPIRTYPITNKYRILLNYFRNEFGIDLHAIGNAVSARY